MQGIYRIYSKASKKSYIGSSRNVRKRMYKEHKTRLRLGVHENSHLQRAWLKYGEDNFEFSILEMVVYEKDLEERELYWITFYNTLDREFGYNFVLPDRSKIPRRKPRSRRRYYKRYEASTCCS